MMRVKCRWCRWVLRRRWICAHGWSDGWASQRNLDEKFVCCEREEQVVSAGRGGNNVETKDGIDLLGRFAELGARERHDASQTLDGGLRSIELVVRYLISWRKECFASLSNFFPVCMRL